MKKNALKISNGIFLMMLVLPAAVWIFLSFTGLRERLDFDTGENRTKHRIQENTPVNELPKELEAWINDRVPFRSVILADDKLLNIFGF